MEKRIIIFVVFTFHSHLYHLSLVEKIRKNYDDITLFKSVGIAFQDVSIGSLVLSNAEKFGIGKNISFFE